MPTLIEVPDSFAEFIADPERYKNAIRQLNGLLQIQAMIVVPDGNTATNAGKPSIRGDYDNMILPIPIKFPAAISDPSGGATVDTQCRAQLAALFATLRRVGLLPP